MFFHLSILLAAQSHYQQDIQSGRSLYETGMMAIQLQGGIQRRESWKYIEIPSWKQTVCKRTYLQTSQNKIKKIGSMMFHVKVKYLKREWFVVPLRIPKQSEEEDFSPMSPAPAEKVGTIFSTSENFVALHNYVYFLKDYL